MDGCSMKAHGLPDSTTCGQSDVFCVTCLLVEVSSGGGGGGVAMGKRGQEEVDSFVGESGISGLTIAAFCSSGIQVLCQS